MARVLRERRDGNNRLVAVDRNHPLYAPMDEIIQATYGPVPVLRELLDGQPGLQEAFIYGSWAARRSGQPGPFPHDIDVIVIGDIDVDTLVAVETTARERLGVVVNIHRTSGHAWQHPDSNPLLETVAARPRIPVVLKQATHV